MRIFGGELLSREKIAIFTLAQESRTLTEVRFRCDLNGRPSEYFLQITHRMGMIQITSPVQ